MAATDTVDHGARLALYWETYGIQPGDSIALAIWIERITPESRLRQLGASLHIATSLNTPVAINWAEARAAHGAVVIPAAVPVIGRHVSVDTSRLPVGDYRIAVAVQQAGRSALRAERTISVR